MSLSNEDKAWFVERFDAIHRRLDAMDVRLDRMDARLDAMDSRFNALDVRCDHLDDYLLNFRTEVIRRFDGLDQRLEFLGSAASNVELRFPPITKAIVDFGVLAGQLSRDQMRATDRDADLASRVARLEEQMSKLQSAA